MKTIFNKKNKGKERYLKRLKENNCVKAVRNKYLVRYNRNDSDIVTIVIQHGLYRTTKEKAKDLFQAYRVVFDDLLYKNILYVEAEPINIIEHAEFAWSLIDTGKTIYTKSGYHKIYDNDNGIIISKIIKENISKSKQTKEWFASICYRSRFYNFYYAQDTIIFNESIISKYGLNRIKSILNDSYYLLSKENLTYEQLEEILYAELYGGRYAKL